MRCGFDYTLRIKRLRLRGFMEKDYSKKERWLKTLYVVFVSFAYLNCILFIGTILAARYGAGNIGTGLVIPLGVLVHLTLLLAVIVFGFVLGSVPQFSLSSSFLLKIKASLLPFYIAFFAFSVLVALDFFNVLLMVFALLGYIYVFAFAYAVLLLTSLPNIIALSKEVRERKGRKVGVSVLYLIFQFLFFLDFASALLICRHSGEAELKQAKEAV